MTDDIHEIDDVLNGHLGSENALKTAEVLSF
jgi:hypothetical protein